MTFSRKRILLALALVFLLLTFSTGMTTRAEAAPIEGRPNTSSSSRSTNTSDEIYTLPDQAGMSVSFKYGVVGEDVRILSPSGNDLHLKVVVPSNGSGIYLAQRNIGDTLIDDDGRKNAYSVTPQRENNGVTIPSNYIYDPNRGSLHDYCTLSPDYLGNADFRGACARHDICYEALKRGQKHHACNVAFKNNLYRVCNGLAYGVTACKAAANVYYSAVEKKNP
ncbi:MAG: phospholipase [Acidipropionibacterium jensenii]|uniref:phospholipase A2 n=1 Tax=Acidipropionibacterium jensenii TaxID=1749 RepID=UPI002647FE64|nr:phospholipase A2 [Acidipropionibacterium jensenii]MDN6441644.1 phospholipase [Acidipropionibacterium jensenii]